MLLCAEAGSNFLESLALLHVGVFCSVSHVGFDTFMTSACCDEAVLENLCRN